MTDLERAKLQALIDYLRIPDFAYGAKLISNLSWRMGHESQAALSAREKYQLDLCCWHYRKKLGGLVSFALPTQEPVFVDYVARPSSTPPPQRSLL